MEYDLFSSITAARVCLNRNSLITGLYPHQPGVGFMTGRLGESPACRERIPNGTEPYWPLLNSFCLIAGMKNSPIKTNLDFK